MKSAARAIRLFQSLARPWPDWRGRAVASFLSGTLKLLRPRGKRIDSNLRLVYPDRDEKWRREIRRGVYENLAWTITEVLALQRDPGQALDWMEVAEGQEVLDTLFSSGQGAVFVTCHFSNWELLGSWYAQTARRHGRQLYAVYQEIHDRDISAILTEYRERGGMRALPKETSTLEMARMLREGAHIAILEDVSWGGGAVLPFMGQPCTNSLGPAVLAMLGGVPIVPAGSYREAPFRHRVRFLKPIPVPREGGRVERLERTIRNINHALEEIITPRPELWFWLHNRWKR